MTEQEITKQGSQQKREVQRDLLVLLAALIFAAVAVLFFDTGSIADWIGRHRDTKVDEAIVVTIILAVGLSAFSLRRWSELSNQVTRFEQLHRQMSKLTRESSLLAELGDLLQ